VAETRSICCYCGVGCGVIIEHDDGLIRGVRGDPEHPANYGRLCSKGSALHLTAQPAAQTHRALHPLVRPAKDLPFRRASWDNALESMADRFAACIETHGPDSVAFYVSGQLLTEDYYVFNKLAKGLVGTNNIDTNSRLCMSSAVTGYKATLGADAPPACYEDIDFAELIFIAGSNTAWAHPVLFRRIEAAKERNPALKVVVVDPRRTATADFGDLHLAIDREPTRAVPRAHAHPRLGRMGSIDAYIGGHTAGFRNLKKRVPRVHAGGVPRICGSGPTISSRAARWFRQSKSVLSLYCHGLNQSSSGDREERGR
jgi:assimilatory nitrate reductase catalytic subunit